MRRDGKGLDAYYGYWTEDARKLGTLVRWQDAAVIPGAFLVRSPGTHPCMRPQGAVYRQPASVMACARLQLTPQADLLNGNMD